MTRYDILRVQRLELEILQLRAQVRKLEEEAASTQRAK